MRALAIAIVLIMTSVALAHAVPHQPSWSKPRSVASGTSRQAPRLCWYIAGTDNQVPETDLVPNTENGRKIGRGADGSWVHSETGKPATVDNGDLIPPGSRPDGEGGRVAGGVGTFGVGYRLAPCPPTAAPQNANAGTAGTTGDPLPDRAREFCWFVDGSDEVVPRSELVPNDDGSRKIVRGADGSLINERTGYPATVGNTDLVPPGTKHDDSPGPGRRISTSTGLGYHMGPCPPPNVRVRTAALPPIRGLPGPTSISLPEVGVTRDIYNEVNLARTNPSAFLKLLDNCRHNYHGLIMRSPTYPNGLITKEGVAAVDDAVHWMSGQMPRQPLMGSDMLTRIAQNLVDEQGKTGANGHYLANGDGPAQRLSKLGGGIFVSESLTYGPSAANDIVLHLFIDDNVLDRGHRYMMMSSEFGYFGVACGPHPTLREVCALEYSNSWDGRGVSWNPSGSSWAWPH